MKIFVSFVIVFALTNIPNSFASGQKKLVEKNEQSRITQYEKDTHSVEPMKKEFDQVVATIYNKYGVTVTDQNFYSGEGFYITQGGNSSYRPVKEKPKLRQIYNKATSELIKIRDHHNAMIQEQLDSENKSLQSEVDYSLLHPTLLVPLREKLTQSQNELNRQNAIRLSKPTLPLDSIIGSVQQQHETQLENFYIDGRRKQLQNALRTITQAQYNHQSADKRSEELRQAHLALDTSLSGTASAPPSRGLKSIDKAIQIRKFIADMLRSPDEMPHRDKLDQQFRLIRDLCRESGWGCNGLMTEAKLPGQFSLILQNTISSSASGYDLDVIKNDLVREANLINFDRETGFSATLLDPHQGVNISSAPPQMQRLFTNVIQSYFDRIYPSIKQSALAGILDLHPSASHDERIFAALNYAGPALQKLFQMLGDKVKTPQMRTMLNRLKSGIHPMLPEELATQLQRTFMVPPPIEIQDKALATASVGEAYLARAIPPAGGSEAPIPTTREFGSVLKIKKFGVDENLAHEFLYFDEIKRDMPDVADIVDELKTSLGHEMDFAREGERLQAGQVYVDPKTQLDVVHFQGAYPAGPEAISILMSRAEGVPLSESNPDLEFQCAKGKLLSSLLNKWLTVALFGNGFYHADLHGGNLFIRYDPTNFLNNLLTLIDFGNADVLTPEHQAQIARLILGVKFGRTQAVMTALGYDPASPGYNARSWKQFSDFFSTERPDKLSIVLDRVNQFGIPLPPYLVNFNRGRILIEQQLEDVRAALRGTPIERSCKLEATASIYSAVFKKNKLKKSLAYKYVGSHHCQVDTPAERILSADIINPVLSTVDEIGKSDAIRSTDVVE